MSHRDAFRELLKDRVISRLVREGGVPAREASDPRWMARYLAAIAVDDPAFARSAIYEKASERCHAAAGEQALADRVSEMYWSPRLRAQATEAWVDFEKLADDPEQAYQLLVQRSAGGRLSAEFDEALTVLGEVREYARESGELLPAAAATPLPSSTAGADTEIQALLGKGRLTETEDRRLTSLYEQRTVPAPGAPAG